MSMISRGIEDDPPNKAETLQQDSALWSLEWKKQVCEIVGAVQRMKPLIKFFVR